MEAVQEKRKVGRPKLNKWQGNYWIDRDVLDEFKAKTLEMGIIQSVVVERLIVRWLAENKDDGK